MNRPSFHKRRAAQNATLLSRERYDGGIASYLEVLDSERTLFNAEIQASQSYRNQLTNYIRLYKSLGGGWLSPEEMEEAQAQPEPDSTE